MKLSIHGHILYQVFKTYCSSIALFKYDFRTILWQSLQFKIELKIKYIYLKILLLCYLKPHPYLEKNDKNGIYNATFSLQCINEDS
jgi:hypothetical protein